MSISITFTGIDTGAGISALPAECEIAVLYNGDEVSHARYLNKADAMSILRKLKHQRRALHVCGSARRELFAGDLDEMLAHVDRVQINGRVTFNDLCMVCTKHPNTTFITQHYHSNSALAASTLPNHAILIDNSGGRGVTPGRWVVPDTTRPVGFAGGIGQDNIVEELRRIIPLAGEGAWIDMESKLRDEDDRFSVNAVRVIHNAYDTFLRERYLLGAKKVASLRVGGCYSLVETSARYVNSRTGKASTDSMDVLLDIDLGGDAPGDWDEESVALGAYAFVVRGINVIGRSGERIAVSCDDGYAQTSQLRLEYDIVFDGDMLSSGYPLDAGIVYEIAPGDSVASLVPADVALSPLEVRALAFAKQCHGAIDQRRRYNGEAYILHPAAVASIIRGVPHTPEMLAAAWLHDIIEDTCTSSSMIASLFGNDVALLVQSLSNLATAADGNRAARKAIERMQIAEAVGEAQTVRLGDVIDNISSFVVTDNFADVYFQEKIDLLGVIHAGDASLHDLALRIVQAKTELRAEYKKNRLSSRGCA